MRRWLIVLVPLLLAGCAWGQGGFDGGNSSDNRSDTALTPANVSELHEVWKLPGSTPVVGGGFVFDAITNPSPIARNALVAYPEGGCTGAGVPTCAEAWSVGGRFSPPATDGTSVFAVNVETNVLQVFAVDGTPRWTYTPAPIAGSTTVLGPMIRIDNGTVWLQVEDTNGSSARTDRLVALPAGGCGASTCAAKLTIPGNQISGFVATEGTVLASRVGAPSGIPVARAYAYDPVTGAERWRSSEAAVVLAARDGRVYAHLVCQSRGCAPVVVYPLRAGANCTGTPAVCTSIASIMRMPNPPVLTEHHVIGMDERGPTWFANDCSGPCGPLANINLPDIPNPVGYASAGGLVFSAGSPSLNKARIYAVDDSLSTCPGGVCTATWTADAATYVHALAVANGRLYAAEADGIVHVYAR